VCITLTLHASACECYTPQKPDHFEVTADIPGFAPEHVNVTVEGRWINIKAERTEDEKAASRTERLGWTHHRVERSLFSLYRRVKLPKTANLDGLSAAQVHGVLTLTIPKRTVSVRAVAGKESTTGRTIPINKA
jgi:HSP20 family protein